jgi:arginase
MRLHVVAIPFVEATPDRPGRAAGLARAAEAFLAAGLVADLATLGGEVERVARPMLDPALSTSDPVHNLGSYNGLVAEAVAAGLRDDAAPLVAGGTCNHLPGILGGLQRVYGPAARIGLVWFDAHGDFNTPRTTRSGMLGGMPVAVAAGLCHPAWRELAGLASPLPTDRIAFVDVRNLDPDEAALINATDATIVSIDDRRPGPDIATVVAGLSAKVDHLYLHVDADVLDRAFQPTHPTAEPDGPTVETTLAAMEHVFATGKVRAFGVVSVNPTGEEGAVSLASGLALLHGGVDAWVRSAADIG